MLRGQTSSTKYSPNLGENLSKRASPQQGDLRLLGPPSGQGAGSAARTRDRKVPADLRADSQATVLPTSVNDMYRLFREVPVWGPGKNRLHRGCRGSGVDGTLDSEHALKSVEILLSRVRAPTPALWPDEGPESLISPCCGLDIQK
ncbi:hypothetical protein PoB_006424500 [Plakobranchus ocellatus]|uniref:Uncharacterized protein n=1 Tax=Plakobranchus ocellatus TaxID=259542 RepID=A0AAV4D135_9GAST|nr:hypothetical protein PoB_006424500 [Plakobranchus ocellatus]